MDRFDGLAAQLRFDALDIEPDPRTVDAAWNRLVAGALRKTWNEAVALAAERCREERGRFSGLSRGHEDGADACVLAVAALIEVPDAP